jgi:hypothetical protein
VITEKQFQAVADNRACSCYPGEGPEPCTRKHALRECWRVAVLAETQEAIVELKNKDRRPVEQTVLEYLMRVRTALDR